MSKNKKVAGFLITASAAPDTAATTKGTKGSAKPPRAVAARPRAQAPSRKEVEAARFYDRAMDYGSDLVNRHAFVATIGAAAAGHQLSKRVLDPAGRAMVGAVKGVMAKKVTDKVTHEVKGAISLSDVADGIGAAFGKLL